MGIQIARLEDSTRDDKDDMGKRIESGTSLALQPNSIHKNLNVIPNLVTNSSYRGGTIEEETKEE